MTKAIDHERHIVKSILPWQGCIEIFQRRLEPVAGACQVNLQIPDGWQARSESEQPIGVQSSQLNHDYAVRN
jgi:hypothetical protein